MTGEIRVEALLYYARQLDHSFVGKLFRLNDSRSGWSFEGRLVEVSHVALGVDQFRMVYLKIESPTGEPVWSGFATPDANVAVPTAPPTKAATE